MFCLLASLASNPATQTTAIYQVSTPSQALAGTETPLPISVTVYYHNAAAGSRLVVGILNASSSPERIVPGVVVYSTDPCINQPGASAVCTVAITKTSGIVKINFQIGGIFGGGQPKVWNLNVTSLLVDSQSNLIPGSASDKLLKIDLNSIGKPDILAVLSQLDYSVQVSIALTAAAIIAILLVLRLKATRRGSDRPRHSGPRKTC